MLWKCDCSWLETKSVHTPVVLPSISVSYFFFVVLCLSLTIPCFLGRRGEIRFPLSRIMAEDIWWPAMRSWPMQGWKPGLCCWLASTCELGQVSLIQRYEILRDFLQIFLCCRILFLEPLSWRNKTKTESGEKHCYFCWSKQGIISTSWQYLWFDAKAGQWTGRSCNFAAHSSEPFRSANSWGTQVESGFLLLENANVEGSNYIKLYNTILYINM